MINTQYEPFVSIIVLVHNAPKYTDITLNSLGKTKGVNHEVIVVDNNSKLPARVVLQLQFGKGRIDKLLHLKENTLFSKGNNIGSSMISPKSTHILLLNSDVRIIDANWLKVLLGYHEQAGAGATAYGLVENPERADGYCFLIDSNLYKKYRLDEGFEWWWSITKLQAQLMKDGYNVTVLKNHDKLLYHYGGKSGHDWKKAKGMDIGIPDVIKWFDKKKVKIIDLQ